MKLFFFTYLSFCKVLSLEVDKNISLKLILFRFFSFMCSTTLVSITYSTSVYKMENSALINVFTPYGYGSCMRNMFLYRISTQAESDQESINSTGCYQKGVTGQPYTDLQCGSMSTLRPWGCPGWGEWNSNLHPILTHWDITHSFSDQFEAFT